MQTSSARDVAFAFYKTAGVMPNFERWVKNTEPYTITPMAKRDKVYAREREKLRQAFKKFEPENDFLVIRTQARVRLVYPQNPESEPLILAYDYLKEDDSDIEYFPFEFAKDNYAVAVNDLDDKKTAELPVKLYEYLKDQIAGASTVTAILQLKPIQADISQPYEYDTLEQWLMVAEIATVSLWTKTGRLIYEYTAPWYFSPDSPNIVPLQQERKNTKEQLN